ncbi:MAG TPA: purine-nucleoside phosphorylase [Elusimicrobia bacterium]|nr:purine-nucleoside phosphorylase [Elusimicrobiota bacterium]
MRESIVDKLKESMEYIFRKTPARPRLGLILGSGLGSLMESSHDDTVIDFSEIPHFKPSTVEGHSGKLIIGNLSGKAVLVMAGRVHYYEGHSMEEVIYPVRLMGYMGVKNLLITSAVGALNPKYRPGDIVVLKDHINFMGVNCLRGPHTREFGARFPDMSEVYDKTWRRKLLSLARRRGLKACEGTYLAVSGPTYETPAEAKAFRKLGADVVGMSVVPEAVAARQMGMSIAAISYVANKASSASGGRLSHAEVLKAGQKISHKLGELVLDIIGAAD